MPADARLKVLASLTGPGAEYEIVERKVRGGAVCRVVKDAPRNVLQFLLDSRAFGDLTYIAYRDEIYSFAEAREQTAKLAWLLEQLGVGRGDRVAVCMRNYPEWAPAFFAPIALGAITVSLNGWWSGEEIAYGLQDAGASVLIADEERLRRIEGQLPALGVRAIAVRSPRQTAGGDRIVDWDQAKRSAPAPPLRPIDNSPDDDCLMLYTSGSTAGPKAAVSTHRNVVHALLAWELENRAQAELRGERPPAEPFEGQRRMLVSIPFFHVTACHVCLLAGLRLGRRLTLMHKWNAEEALELIERERITHFISVPTITGDLVRVAAERNRTLPSLLAIGGGGSHRPAHQVQAIRETFENALPGTGWGMTETNAIGTQITSPDYLRRPRSSGLRSVLMDLKIVDANGRELPRGETGEVWVRGVTVVREYRNKPEATARAFEDGWFKTGDLAYVDDEGFVFFVDRIKDIVIRGGENISCLRVEDALHRCEGVAEAVAFGIPHERLGEELAAVVVPLGDAVVTEDRIRASLEGHVGQFEIPSRILIRREPLPRIATGKFAKRRIREALLAETAVPS